MNNMDNNEEIEIVALKKEMDEAGEKNMSKENKARYIVLRRKQKADRRNAQETILKEHSKSFIGKFGILLGLIPLIVIVLIVWMILSMNPSDYKDDCVIGRDSPDCLEGGGSGHPLWNN